jgi:hypothetical protein
MGARDSVATRQCDTAWLADLHTGRRLAGVHLRLGGRRLLGLQGGRRERTDWWAVDSGQWTEASGQWTCLGSAEAAAGGATTGAMEPSTLPEPGAGAAPHCTELFTVHSACTVHAQCMHSAQCMLHCTQHMLHCTAAHPGMAWRRPLPDELLLPVVLRRGQGAALHCTALHCTALHCTAHHIIMVTFPGMAWRPPSP